MKGLRHILSMTAKMAYIGVGSNLGEKLGYCLSAIDLVDRIPGCSVEDRSPFFRTEPVGVTGQDWYVNGVISLRAEIPAQELLNRLLAIEEGMGRERRKKWDSRCIDLDILIFGKDIINEEDLSVPHPLMHLRRFVLAPMVLIAPDLVHPLLGKTMSKLLEDLSGNDQAVMPLENNVC